MGDFNFSSLKWEDKLLKITQDMSNQQKIFASFLGKFYLLNCVGVSTRGENILDLILTNDENLIPEVWVEESGSFSDHRWVIGDLDVILAWTDDISPESILYDPKLQLEEGYFGLEDQVSGPSKQQ